MSVDCPRCGRQNPDDANFCGNCGRPLSPGEQPAAGAPDRALSDPDDRIATPLRVADGRYLIRDFVGEGARKLVYLAHDTVLDREVALALVKTRRPRRRRARARAA